jgi:hypothetical protein
MSWRGLTWPLRTGPPIARLPCAIQPAASVNGAAAIPVSRRFQRPGIPPAYPEVSLRIPGVSPGLPGVFSGRQCLSPEFPLGEPLPSPEFPPDLAFALAVRKFLLRWPALRKTFRSLILRLLMCPHGIHRNLPVIPRQRKLSTALSTLWSTSALAGAPLVASCARPGHTAMPGRPGKRSCRPRHGRQKPAQIAARMTADKLTRVFTRT